MNIAKSRIPNEVAVDFVSKFNEIYFRSISHHLSSFVEDGFLKDLFEKNPSVPKDKAQLLIGKFGEVANPANFSQQAQATNIQPTTLSLIFSIAFYAASRSWDNFSSHFLSEFGNIYNGSDDMLDESSEDEPDEDEDLGNLSQEDLLSRGLQTPPPPKPVIVMPPTLPDIVMTPVDPPVTPENSRKKDKQKARVTEDKQVKHQSTTAKPDAKTPAKNSQKEKKSSEPEVIQLFLTGYEAVDDERERVRDIVYDIPYTWEGPRILLKQLRSCVTKISKCDISVNIIPKKMNYISKCSSR
ncbi:unnamed protein product [Rhizophagus irregularis]|nr:unnamed protein product [Rhizophagus irregularis]